jgi:hypothetical protein
LLESIVVVMVVARLFAVVSSRGCVGGRLLGCESEQGDRECLEARSGDETSRLILLVGQRFFSRSGGEEALQGEEELASRVLRSLLTVMVVTAL